MISVCLGCTAGHPRASVLARGGSRGVGQPPGGRLCWKVLEAGPCGARTSAGSSQDSAVEGWGAAGVALGPKEMKAVCIGQYSGSAKAGSVCTQCNASLNLTFRLWILRSRCETPRVH